MAKSHRIVLSVTDHQYDLIMKYNALYFDPPLPVATVCESLIFRALMAWLALAPDSIERGDGN